MLGEEFSTAGLLQRFGWTHLSNSICRVDVFSNLFFVLFGVDIVYIPYLERMNASLFYYKGYDLRAEHPKLGAWFSSLERLDNYRGIIADFHTHAHDLPPQMGGCYSSGTAEAKAAAALVDEGPYVQGLLGKQVFLKKVFEPAPK